MAAFIAVGTVGAYLESLFISLPTQKSVNKSLITIVLSNYSCTFGGTNNKK